MPVNFFTNNTTAIDLLADDCIADKRPKEARFENCGVLAYDYMV